MPELPEVETVRRGLDRYLPGRSLRTFEFTRRDLRWPIPIPRCKRLAGRACTGTSRRSKYLCLHFDGKDEPIAMIHLGMSGRLWVEAEAPTEWRSHEHWRMDFGDRILRFVDPRRFGMLDVTTAAQFDGHKLIRGLGPEPLGLSFDGEYLFARTRRRKVATKTFLMDA